MRPVARTVGGFRLYDHDTIERLLLIKQMKPLGFTLEEMRLLIETRDRLDDPALDPDERTDLRERVALFSVGGHRESAGTPRATRHRRSLRLDAARRRPRA